MNYNILLWSLNKKYMLIYLLYNTDSVLLLFFNIILFQVGARLQIPITWNIYNSMYVTYVFNQDTVRTFSFLNMPSYKKSLKVCSYKRQHIMKLLKVDSAVNEQAYVYVFYKDLAPPRDSK